MVAPGPVKTNGPQMPEAKNPVASPKGPLGAGKAPNAIFLLQKILHLV